MSISDGLKNELQLEAATTTKLIERLPEDKYEWKPHEKSMTTRVLATHVVEMAGWITMICKSDSLDFAMMDYKQPVVTANAELLAMHEKNLNEAVAALGGTDDEQMMQTWTMRNGETVFMSVPRIQALRGMVMNHIYHHRGQLSVYLRLNEIPVPAMYGPSADKQAM